jgi:hypothetical protein
LKTLFSSIKGEKMAWKLEDVSKIAGVLPLSGANMHLRSLIDSLRNENNNLIYGNKTKASYFNHADNRDPASAGGTCSASVSVLVYYAPASDSEYRNWEVVDDDGFFSGRRRLLVRKYVKSLHPVEDIVYSFWQASHPKEDSRVRTNRYTTYVPVNCNA